MELIYNYFQFLSKLTCFDTKQVKQATNNIWTTLNIDPHALPEYMTLQDFGMESLLAIEVQNEFELELNIHVDINKIKNISIKAEDQLVMTN